ncbi:hypothetical protein PSFL_40860 [Pseudomonas sp. DD1]|uniref:hypothetical protein n=1 Tax=Pseudomonas sp. DD1 TaxID=879558 RepID=UPI0037C5F748
MLNVLKIQGGSWLASDSGGSADINPSNTAAIAASLGLDSSHLDLQGGGLHFSCHRRMHTVLNVLKIQGGSWLASDSGGSAKINPSNAAAIAASLGLDSSHLDLQGVEDCISAATAGCIRCSMC